jgi:hypothetical protein
MVRNTEGSRTFSSKDLPSINPPIISSKRYAIKIVKKIGLIITPRISEIKFKVNATGGAR